MQSFSRIFYNNFTCLTFEADLSWPTYPDKTNVLETEVKNILSVR